MSHAEQSSLTADTVSAVHSIAPVRVPAWADLPWLWHGFSTRAGGVSRVYLPEEAGSASPGELNLGFTAHDSEEHVRENRARFVASITGSRATPYITARQVHSCRSVEVDEDLALSAKAALPGSTFVQDADGLMTRQAGLLLGIQTADCVPVLVADPVERAVAAFHAGWRGTVEAIVESGIGRMQAEFGSDPANLIAAIGPAIGPCCYTVGDEVVDRFSARFRYASALFTASETGENSPKLNLAEANRRQLLTAGLKESSIAVVGGCTSCQPQLFFSHRASGGRAGRMMNVIGIRQER